jgi:hypothetical protein
VVVGDGESGSGEGRRLYAARVGIAACHQANAVLEVIINGAFNG